MDKIVMRGGYQTDEGSHGWRHELHTDPDGKYFFISLWVDEWSAVHHTQSNAHASLDREDAIELMAELEQFIHRTAEGNDV